jgi:uncharacterized phiE125 gp8 family phage protein
VIAVQYQISVPVAAEPISLADAKLHLRLSETAEDALLARLITASREFCENITRRALATQIITAFLDDFPCRGYFELPRPPLQSVTSVKYKDSAGVETTMTPAIGYIVDAESNVGRVMLPYGCTWPSFVPYPVNPIRVEYIAGYCAANPIPESIKQAMLLLVGHWYTNREATGTATGQIELAVKALLGQFKAGWF